MQLDRAARAERRQIADFQQGELGSLTVLVPTRNERDNIEPLLERLAEVARTLPFTVLFVDDSSDDTPEVIEQLTPRAECVVELLHRPAKQRTGGLGGAV